VRLTSRAARGGVPLALALAAACANTGEPPGGPPDEKPPVILGVYPESGAVLPNPRGDAVIQFDGVIDEQSGGGTGPVTGLASRILLSPTAGPVTVSWHRSAIHVKPKEGWKPGRIYQLQILPGIADLRRNVMKQRRTIVFSTGPVIPHASLAGTAILWVEQRALVGGLVRAQLLPDTLAYLALVDSSGGFRFDDLPPGRYAVFAIADQNGNRVRDRREAFDSALVSLDSTATAVLFAFVHDTTGPKLRQADPLDSVAARLTFTQPLDPGQALASLRVRVVALPDSTPVRVRGLFVEATYDSLAALQRAALDSARAAHDTTRKPSPPPRDTTHADTLGRPAARPDTSGLHLILRQRPVPQDKLVLRFDTTLTPGAKYFVEVRGARNLTGIAADGHTVLVVPKPKPPPERPDSTRAPRDSTKP
jgi:Big-like domain-containing protein